MEMKYVPYSSVKELNTLSYMWTFYTYTNISQAEFKKPNIQNRNCDICTGYSWCVNVELCNSVSISMLWQHKISVNKWMEYHKVCRNSKNFIWLMSQ